MHVLIDSCIYRQDRRRNKPPFRAIKRVAGAGHLQLHLPAFVKQEVISQQVQDTHDEINKITGAAARIARLTNDTTLRGRAEELERGAAAMKTDAAKRLADEFQGWITDTHTTEHSIKPEHARRVTDAYFGGTAPFRSAKFRGDFPDSFIWETALDLVTEHGELTVISADGRLRTAAEKHPVMDAYKSLEDFIESEEYQEALAELKTSEAITENIERITQLLPAMQKTLEDDLNQGMVNELAWKTVRHAAIPDDNNEATITSVDEAENAEFNFAEVEHFGDGDFSIPFTATVECELNYTIHKGDYYTHPDAEEIYVEEWSDHYFDANQTYTISIAGYLNLMIDTELLGNEEISEDDLRDIVTEADYGVDVTNRAVHVPEY